MLLFWLSIFFFSLLQIFLYPIYSEQNNELWPFLLGLGCVLNVLGCYRFSLTSLQDRYNSSKKTFLGSCLSLPPNALTLLFLVPLVLSIFAFRFPYNLPPHVLIIGIILVYFIRHKAFRPICTGIFLSGLIIAFQTVCVIPYFKFAARFHEINMFSPIFYWILKGLGVSCAYSQDTIFVQTTQANLALVTSWEKLGLFIFVTFAIGTLVFFYFVSGSISNAKIFKKLGVLFSVMFCYVISRYVFLSMIFIEISKPEIFWMPIIVTASFFPLPFILWRFVRFKSNEPYVDTDNAITDNKNEFFFINKHSFLKVHLSIGIAMFFFSFAMINAFWFQDPGILKKGRVLIDEHYSNWEWTDKEFDTQWYGVKSVYNYYCFADYLNHFYSIDRLRVNITEDKLEDYDVFIVKTPTTSFSKEEIDTIEQFVKNGGGLFIIGDHTNVFGTTINLNPLAERFGVRFNYDATYDLVTSDLHFHKKNRLYSHASVKDMPYFLFATSCSMYTPFFAEDTMIASNLKTMYLDYSRGGYFPDKNKELNYTFGLFLQSSGLKYGKGRVLAFSDSTCFSNFYMHIPGKPEYALGSINWLNRINRYDFTVKLICFIVMAISFGFILLNFFTVKKYGSKQIVQRSFARILVFAGLFGISISTIFCDIVSSRSYELPKEHTQMVKIGFEEEFCNFKIPSLELLHNPSIDFQTFYVWSQRLGYVPTLFSLDDSLDSFDMIVLVNPQRYFTEKEKKKIENYIVNGGRLLLIDHPKGYKSTANQIMSTYGLEIDYKEYQENVEVYDGVGKLATLKSFSPIKGGSSLLFTKEKNALLSIAEHGKGTIAAMACSSSFTNKEMGETESVPNKHQQFLYKLEFWILSSMVENEFSLFEDFVITKN